MDTQNLEQQLLSQLKEIKRICEENNLDYGILSQYLMTQEEYDEWYAHELSKYESQKEEYETYN